MKENYDENLLSMKLAYNESLKQKNTKIVSREEDDDDYSSHSEE
jgi:hypothetical protein